MEEEAKHLDHILVLDSVSTIRWNPYAVTSLGEPDDKGICASDHLFIEISGRI